LLAAAAEVDSGSAKGDCFAGGLSTAGARNAIAVVIAGTAADACVVNGAAGIPAKRVRKVGKNRNNTGEAAPAVATTGEGRPVMKMVEIQMGVAMAVMGVADLLQIVAATGTGQTAASVPSVGRCRSELSANVLSKNGEKHALWS